MRTTTTPRFLRALCAVAALLLLAAPTMALCVECVSGSCHQRVAVHALAAVGADVAQAADALPADPAASGSKGPRSKGPRSKGHCDGVRGDGAATEADPADAVGASDAGAAVTSTPGSPVFAGGCCATQPALGHDEGVTRGAGSEFGLDVLASTHSPNPTVAVEEFSVSDRSEIPIPTSPLYRLHAALLL